MLSWLRRKLLEAVNERRRLRRRLRELHQISMEIDNLIRQTNETHDSLLESHAVFLRINGELILENDALIKENERLMAMRSSMLAMRDHLSVPNNN